MGHGRRKGIDIQSIRSEENPDDIMTKNTSEVDFARHMRRISEGEIWELMDTGRENVKKKGVTDDIITYDKTEYFIHALDEVKDGTKRND